MTPELLDYIRLLFIVGMTLGVMLYILTPRKMKAEEAMKITTHANSIITDYDKIMEIIKNSASKGRSYVQLYSMDNLNTPTCAKLEEDGYFVVQDAIGGTFISWSK